jgi:hypothetical protein
MSLWSGLIAILVFGALLSGSNARALDGDGNALPHIYRAEDGMDASHTIIHQIDSESLEKQVRESVEWLLAPNMMLASPQHRAVF